MHSLERPKVSKSYTFFSDLLGHHDAIRWKVPDFTLEIQAYKLAGTKFLEKFGDFSPQKKNTNVHMKFTFNKFCATYGLFFANSIPNEEESKCAYTKKISQFSWKKSYKICR
jgi:hypothetical protein